MADSDPEEARRAAEAAAEAFEAWSRTTAHERAHLLQRWADLKARDEQMLARLMAQEMGKPVRESLAEVRICGWVRYLVRGRGQAPGR